MSDTSILHDECLGFDSRFGVSFIDDNIFCIRSGNFLQVCQFKDRALDVLNTINGELTGFSSMSGSPLHHLFSYADQVQNPLIHFYDSNCKEVGSTSMNGTYGIRSLNFSYDGQWLYALGDLPSFRLSAFKCSNREEVAFQTFEMPIGKFVSCNPIHSRLIAVYGEEDLHLPSIPSELESERNIYLRFYNLQGSKGHYAFIETISEVNCSISCLSWSPKDECVVGTKDGRILFINPHDGKIVSEAFYLDSLDDGQQYATSIFCTTQSLILSGSSGNIYWLNVSNINETNDIYVFDVGSPILFFQIFPRSNFLLFGTENNSLLCIELDEKTHRNIEGSMICLREAHMGSITSVCSLPHQILTAGSDGTVRMWSFSPYLSQINKFSFNKEVLTCINSSKGGSLVVVGSQSGVVRIMNTIDPESPVLLFRERLHSGSVSSIVITDFYIISGSSSGSVVILKSDPVQSFPLIGLLQLRSNIISLTSPPPLNNIQQLLIATDHREILRVDLPENPPENYKIGLETMNRAMLKVSNKVFCIVAEPNLREEQQYFFCACDDKSVKYYCMPITTGDLDIVGVDDVESSSPDDTFSGHSKSVTSLSLSPNQQFIASGCSGGTLIVREIDVSTAQIKRVLLTVTHHSPITGYISSICFSPDGRKLFTVGHDGCINTYNIRSEICAIHRDHFTVPSEGSFKGSISRMFGIDHQIRSLSEMWQNREYDISDENGFQADDGNGIEETPLIQQIRTEKLRQQQIEVNEFQNSIRERLSTIQGEFMHLVEENDQAPELEKLTKTDFTLDISTAERLQQLAQVRSSLVHYRRRIKNQIRSLMCQTITNNYFQRYEPKLCTLFSFKTPISFDNFPLPVLDSKTKRRLQCVSLLRRTEIAALRYKPSATGPNRILSTLSRDPSLDGSRYLFSRTNSIVQISQSEQNDQELVVKDESRLLYDPFQLITGNRKITQIIIIQFLIFRTMNQFNSVFDDMVIKKQNTVQSLEEKNKRIRQLIRLLKLNESDYSLYDVPTWEDESPESFLKVRDNEIHLKKNLEHLSKTQEKRDELEKDSFAERALRQMMGGNVNMANIEEAPGDDEPIAPEWMSSKKKEELTEEEQYQIQEFEKKKKNWIEEREKRKKTLSAELVKLYKNTSTIIEDFDRLMCNTYMQRFDTEERVYYHELEIMHLISALYSERHLRDELNSISEEAITKHELFRQRSPLLAELSSEATSASKLSSSSEENLDSLKSQVQKEFKNKDSLPQLLKWYNQSIAKRVRPKIHNGANAFQQYYCSPIEFISNMDEILPNRPSSLPEQSWKNFLEYCETKLRASRESAERSSEASELRLREKTFREEMDLLQKRFSILESKQSETIDKLLHALVDMHVPFTFRQGQVEIPSDTVLVEYNDIVLIDRKVVIDRNQLIIEAGQRKLQELENIRQQRSNHKVLKWEIDKSRVDLTNLKEEIQEYQLFRVTKYDQELIRSRLLKGQNGESSKTNNELKSLQDGLDHMLKQHEVKVERSNSTLEKLTSKLNKKKEENDRIESEIVQMQLGLKERKRIYAIQMKSSEGAQDARKRRLKQVMMISRLKRAKQVQESKINELKQEVIRLRKSVYTSFNDGEDFEAMVGYKS